MRDEALSPSPPLQPLLLQKKAEKLPPLGREPKSGGGGRGPSIIKERRLGGFS